MAAAHRVVLDTLRIRLGLIRGLTLLSRHHSPSLSIVDEFKCISEVIISPGPRAAFLRNVDGRRQFSRKRFTVVDTLVSLVQLEYLVGSKRSSVLVEKSERSCEYSWYCLQTYAGFLIPIFFSGHPVSSCIKYAGPFHQLSS